MTSTGGTKADVEWDSALSSCGPSSPNVVRFEAFELGAGLSVGVHDEAFSFIVG